MDQSKDISHSLPGDVGMREAVNKLLHDAEHYILDLEPAVAHMSAGRKIDRKSALAAISRVRLGLAALTPSAPQWNCAARKSNTGASDPQDCNWPVCGCDPHADKVIAALDEMGLLLTPSALSGDAGEGE